MAYPAVSAATALTWIIDPTTGALVVEGLTAPAALALTGGLLPPPQPLNCARPLDAPPASGTAPPITAAPESPSEARDACPADGAPTLRVARIYHGSVVDGPGRRSVVQVQGCPIRCPGFIYSPRGGAGMSS